MILVKILEDINKIKPPNQLIKKQLSNIPDKPEENDSEQDNENSMRKESPQRLVKSHSRATSGYNRRYKEAKANR